MYFALAFSFVFHWLLDCIIRTIPPNTFVRNCKHEHVKFLLSGNDFTWRNSMVSLFHAIVTGIWSLVAFYLNPKLSEDLIDVYSDFTLALVAYSTGYFLMDSMHMYYLAPTRATYELLIHHCVIISCFSSALLSEKFIGYAVVALLVEVNSIFLHLRRILKYLRIPMNSSLSYVTCLGNIGTFIIFRLLVLSWMTRWLVVNRDNVSFGFYCLGSIGLAVIMFMNIVLFVRIVYTDFRSNSPEAASLVASASVTSKNGRTLSIYTTPVVAQHSESTG